MAIVVFTSSIPRFAATHGEDRGIGSVARCDAAAHILPNDFASAIVTDPPYYNAVPYADLSDFFHTWLRRTVGKYHPDLFDTPLAPKDQEICEMAGWDERRYKHKDRKWFEERMR